MDKHDLAEMTKAAAAALAASTTAAVPEGAALSCTYAGGARVVVRNSLQPVSGFSAQFLLSQISGEIVRALLAQRVVQKYHSERKP